MKTSVDVTWGCDRVGLVAGLTPATTNPAHTERIGGRIKTTAPTGMCHIQLEALLSLHKALVLCHVPEICSGEGGSGKEWYFSHWSTKSQTVGLCDSHRGRRRGWVIKIIITIILSSRQMLLTPHPVIQNQLTPQDNAIMLLNQLCQCICVRWACLLECVTNLSNTNEADFSGAFHFAKSTKVAHWGQTLLSFVNAAVVWSCW